MKACKVIKMLPHLTLVWNAEFAYSLRTSSVHLFNPLQVIVDAKSIQKDMICESVHKHNTLQDQKVHYLFSWICY